DIMWNNSPPTIVAAAFNSPGPSTFVAFDSANPTTIGSATSVFNVELPNSAPTDLSLTGSTVLQGQPIGPHVGTPTPTDPDADNTFTYTLVPGAGSTDNASFFIAGGTLKTLSVLTTPAPKSYAIRIRSTDQGGLFTEKAITITEIDRDPTDLML